MANLRVIESRYHLLHSPKLERTIIKTTRQVTLATIDDKLTLCPWLTKIMHYDFNNNQIRELVIRINQTTQLATIIPNLTTTPLLYSTLIITVTN